MKISLARISNAVPALNKLVVANLPIKIAFRLNRVVKGLNVHLESLTDLKQKAAEKYGVKVEGGIEIPNEKIPEFEKELQELLSEEIEIEFEPINIDLLPDSIELSSNEVSSLDGVFLVMK